MKNDKEWLKKQVNSEYAEVRYIRDNYSADERVLLLDDVNELIDKLDEPDELEEVVIPQWFDSWLYEMDDEDFSTGEVVIQLWGEFAFDRFSKSQTEWLKDNTEMATRAILDDNYTVEREKSYRLESSNGHLEDNYLCIGSTGTTYGCEQIEWIINNGLKYVFTESELADIDETGFEREEVAE